MKKGLIIGLLISMLLISGISGCAKNKNNQVSIGILDNVTEANNQFSLDLYQRYSPKGGNLFFSPYSISSALAMTYEGARGQTAEEMQEVMHFPNDLGKMRSDFVGINNELNKAGKPYKLSVANALWAQKDYAFIDSYFNVVNDYYGGKVTNLDFKTDAENSRITINKWVENKTNDKIKDLLPKDPPVITPDTRLVLTNAIYFKANWSQEFAQEGTFDEDFNLTSKKPIKVPMMHQTSAFDYMENGNIQILEMDYLGDDLSMLVILPKENNLADLEGSISLKSLEAWEKEMKSAEVEVTMPKFKFETKYFMANDLKEMGMPVSFSDLADFSGMTGKQDLKISQVIHQTFINVSESGTEAAAATAVVMFEVTGIPTQRPKPKIFNANHPFIFLIQEKSTGTILFMGRVNDPSK